MRIPKQSQGVRRDIFRTFSTLLGGVKAQAKKGEDFGNATCRRENNNGTTTTGSCKTVCKGLDTSRNYGGGALYKCKEPKKKETTTKEQVVFVDPGGRDAIIFSPIADYIWLLNQAYSF